MSDDDTNSIFVYLKEIPSELSVGIVLFILLCCLCSCRSCICDCISDRRAERRIRRLERIQRETQEIEFIRSFKRRNTGCAGLTSCGENSNSPKRVQTVNV